MKKTAQRLRPMGRVYPRRLKRVDLRAWLLGFGDGWRQPHYLSTSSNVEHLRGYDDDVQESLDTGINAGQWLRSPLNHQQD